ncbi:MAG: ABC transporter substrate-binding protein [Leucobacter sp.]
MRLYSRRRAAFAAGAIAAGLALSLTGCGQSSAGADGGDVTITYAFWGNDDRASATQEAIDIFESDNPGIKVSMTFSAFDAYQQKLATQIAGKSAPDVFMLEMSYVRDFQERGVLSDFADPEFAAIDTSNVPESLLNTGVIDDTLIGIASGRASQALYVDATTWESYGATLPEDGWTWDDLRAAAQKIDEGSGGSQVAMADFGWNEKWLDMWLHQNGKSQYDDQGKVNFTEQDLVDFWTFVADLRDAGVLTDPEITSSSVDEAMQNSPLVKKNSLSEFNHTSLSEAYVSAFGDVLAVAPPTDDPGNFGLLTVASQHYAVPKTSEHKEEAAKFIDFMINNEEAGPVLGLVRGLPTSDKVLELIAPDFSESEKMIYDYQMRVGDTEVPMPLPPAGHAATKKDMIRIYQNILFEQSSIEEGAEELFGIYEANNK